MAQPIVTRAFRTFIGLGLAHPNSHEHRAAEREVQWRWPVLVALLATIPAFYLELMEDTHVASWVPRLLYCLGAAVLALALWRVAAATRQPTRHLRRNWLDLLQILGLLACAGLPDSIVSHTSLTVRLLVALMTLVRMVWALQRLFERAGTTYLLGLAGILLALCGAGFYWLDPKITTLSDGLWLAFTTAATVGYGDLVPSTTASRVFSVFVVLLGFGMLSLVTASIAAMFVESEERRMETEILRDLHHEISGLRSELAALRAQAAAQNTVVDDPARSPSPLVPLSAAMASRPSNSSDSTSS